MSADDGNDTQVRDRVKLGLGLGLGFSLGFGIGEGLAVFTCLAVVTCRAVVFSLCLAVVTCRAVIFSLLLSRFAIALSLRYVLPPYCFAIALAMFFFCGLSLRLSCWLSVLHIGAVSMHHPQIYVL